MAVNARVAEKHTSNFCPLTILAEAELNIEPNLSEEVALSTLGCSPTIFPRDFEFSVITVIRLSDFTDIVHISLSQFKSKNNPYLFPPGTLTQTVQLAVASVPASLTK